MIILRFLICFKLAVGLCFFVRADEPKAKDQVQATADIASSKLLSFASTNKQVLLDVLSRNAPRLIPAANDPDIARKTALILEQSHYLQHPLDDEISSKLLDHYLDVLDPWHLHFLQSDLSEFEKYRTTLDDLLEKEGDTAPARHIFNRFLKRLEERVGYVGEVITTEKFEFAGNDRYNIDRRKSPRPKDLEDAKQLWRQHLRLEILNEKLSKEKPEEIASKITRRYARLLRTFKDYDNDDIFEIYLTSLAQVYDPHSDYMGKSQLETFNIGMKLSLVGIGALLESVDGYCRIKQLMPGPAARSKQVKPNDRIVAVAQGEGEPVDVVDMKLNKVVDMIRGTKGTEVRLTIIPADATDPSTRKIVRLIRDEVKLEDQEAKAKVIDVPVENGKTARLGIIDLPSFYADFELTGRRTEGPKKSTTRDVTALINKLKRENVAGIILDLRRNGGGSLEEAINLTGLFIKSGPVVQVKGLEGRPIVDEDTNPEILYDGPLIVLTSRFSASASEILAGALQDYGRALIVGDSSTHGKGTVQSLIQLDRHVKQVGPILHNPGALKLTIRKFYRASGASTQLNGVIPDIVLPSRNNYLEVGEAALENPLPYDTIPSANYEKLNRIQPILADLREKSAKRQETDKDFAYVREDIEQTKKALADKSVSLNEEQRLKEKQEEEARMKARQTELKSRPPVDEKIYEITLKQAELPGLPPAVGSTNSVAKTEAPNQPAHEEGDEEANGDAKIPVIDVPLKEAKRILIDLISSLSRGSSVAAASQN